MSNSRGVDKETATHTERMKFLLNHEGWNYVVLNSCLQRMLKDTSVSHLDPKWDLTVPQRTRDRCPTKVTLSVGSVGPSAYKQD